MFSKGLIKSPKESLASTLALWDSLDSLNLAKQKAIELWRKEKGILESNIQERKIDYKENYSDEYLKVRILSNVCECLKIPLPVNMTLNELEILERRIEEETVNLLRKSEKTFSGTKIDDVIYFMIEKTMKDLEAKFKEKSSQEQDKIVDEIYRNLKEMPPEMQQKLKSELDIDELTSDSIKKAIMAGTFATAFSVVVKVAGFSAYLIAVKTLAAITGFIGITLPFAAYTTLTSAIAFLSNPIIAGAGVLGIGYFLKKYTDKKIRLGVAPFLVGQIAMNADERPKDYDSKIKNFIEIYNQKMKESQTFETKKTA